MRFKVSHYGWLPDLPDQRDFLYASPVELAGAPPARADLRALCPRVYDQGQLGSCTANAIGGHAAVAGIGYDDSRQWFIVRNSWGRKWGMNGYFTLPYAYLTDETLASDFWTIRVVQQ